MTDREPSPLAASVRAARLDAASGAFLRLRPRVIAPGMGVVCIVLFATGEPISRLVPLGALYTAMVALFVWEARRTRSHPVDARWLLRSLALTVAGIAGACALTGGLVSPLIPMFFAPTVVAFAAFGRARESLVLVGLVGLALIALAIVRALAPWPPIDSPPFEVILAASTMISLGLLYAGVGGLSDAHARSEATLDRMRAAVLEESEARLRAMESVGTKVAHEVRNPLASIKGLVQLLARGAREPREERRFEVVLAEVERLNSILDDYLTFARPLDDLRPAPVAIERLLADVAAVVEAGAREKGVVLRVEAEPAVVLGDRRRLEAALMNLATNALAATREGGGVTLRAKVIDDVTIEVEDDGEGMDEETLARIGTPYFTTKREGTGLGVALARATFAQHGGRLEFTSRVGEGTVATIVLPRGGGASA